jgi:hypothetical protein
MTTRHPLTKGSPPGTIKILGTPLSRRRERVGVRVDMISGIFPLTFLLSPVGRGIKRFYFLGNFHFDNLTPLWQRRDEKICDPFFNQNQIDKKCVLALTER